MIGICKKGHQTGQRRCVICGADRVEMTPGAGTVQVKKHQRPRDANGRNALDELRRSTSVSGGVQRPRMREYLRPPYAGLPGMMP